MVIRFRLAWLKASGSAGRQFKLKAAGALYQEYLDRISKFTACETLPFGGQAKRSQGGRLWVCDESAGAKAMSSAKLAETLEQTMAVSKTLEIAIGGPDGFSAGALERIPPDLKWSFGPLTLPHELAAVVAAEQIYRAYTILKGLPYHKAH